jgi:hypothetical protein
MAPPLRRAPRLRRGRCGLALVLVSRALAAARAEGLLSELQAGAGVAASEQNAADLALLACFYQERRMRPIWIRNRTGTVLDTRVVVGA